MPQRPLTVEVFRDIETPEVPLEGLHAGIEQMTHLAVGLTLERSGRRMRLSKPDAASIDLDKIDNWPRFTADINVVATTRPLTTTRELRVPSQQSVGLRIIGDSCVEGPLRKKTRVAVVRVASGINPSNVTRHEVGHLLDVCPKRLALPEDSGHCATSKCLMYPAYEKAELPELGELLVRGREHVRRRAAAEFLRQTLRTASWIDFCGSCAESIGRNAFFLTKAINGEFVPDVLLPHYRNL